MSPSSMSSRPTRNYSPHPTLSSTKASQGLQWLLSSAFKTGCTPKSQSSVPDGAFTYSAKSPWVSTSKSVSRSLMRSTRRGLFLPWDTVSSIPDSPASNRSAHHAQHLLPDFPYSSYASSSTSLIHSSRLGRLVNITHLEPVGYYHFAHSYIRGHWKAEATSASLALTKSSHDIDIFCKWLSPLVPSKVSSFAGLGHFRKERKPEGAEGVTRCLKCPDNIESRCEYSAKKSPSYIHSPPFAVLGLIFRQFTSHVSKVVTDTGQ